MFEVSVRQSFEATHALRGSCGADEPPHAHRFRCEVTIAAEALDDAGCAVDFAEADVALARAIAPFEGRALHESPPFSKESPSAENIARYLFRVLSESLRGEGRRVARVTVWEDGGHSATYFEEDAGIRQ